MTKNNTSPKTAKEKEIQLLHLDGVQREVLANIINKFLSGSKIEITEVADALQKYVLALAERSSAGEKHCCEADGSLSPSCQSAFKKFTDAIALCSKYHLDYNKIFSAKDVRVNFAKASAARDRFTVQHMHALGYHIKINTYSTLESDDRKVDDYIANMEDFYLRSIASINPAIAKRTFVEHIVGMFIVNHNHTISDIAYIASKYAEYLGKEEPTQDKIEELVHKYSDISNRMHEGFLQAAKVEVFKLLEGI